MLIDIAGLCLLFGFIVMVVGWRDEAAFESGAFLWLVALALVYVEYVPYE